MNVESIVYKNLEKVIGLPEDELRTMPDINLREEDLIDSLSLAELLSSVSLDLGVNIDFKQFKPEDFDTITSIIEAVESQING